VGLAELPLQLPQSLLQGREFGAERVLADFLLEVDGFEHGCLDGVAARRAPPTECIADAAAPFLDGTAGAC
jgi:hypothetical protein